MANYIKIFLLAGSMVLTAGIVNAQSFKSIVNQVENDVNNPNNNNNGQNNNSFQNLSNSDVIAALKQALQIGAQNSSKTLNAVNGYFGNPLIKIIMPPQAEKVERTLRDLGLGDVVDKAILSMNRAAEDAAIKAAPIFINAIASMSIQDGLTILRGGNGAATNYLKGKTSQQLTDAFKPVISQSLDKVNATKYWSDVFNAYNQLPTTFNKVNPDLTAYVTQKALDGLFVTIASEENKIRNNASARVTDLLQKVFGAH